MPTMRLNYTRVSSDITWQWEDAAVTNAIDAEQTFCESNYSMTIGPVVTVSDLEQYQDFTFPTTTDFENYINHYNDPDFTAPVPPKAGISSSLSFP